MGRPLRMITHEESIYHVISRTALPGLPFESPDKDMFTKIVKHFTGIYFSDLLGFCCMSNHFHLILKMYDLMYADGPGGEHSMSLAGEEILG